MKMLSKRLRGINARIKETKDSLEKLESEKALIKTLFAKEKEKMKTGLEMSSDTSFSKCSVDIKSMFHKDLSLDKISSSINLTTPPSKSGSGGQTGENRFNFHKLHSKSMTFTDRVDIVGVVINGRDAELTASPEFRRQTSLEDQTSLKDLEAKIEENSQENSLSELEPEPVRKESRVIEYANQESFDTPNLGPTNPSKNTGKKRGFTEWKKLTETKETISKSIFWDMNETFHGEEVLDLAAENSQEREFAYRRARSGAESPFQ